MYPLHNMQVAIPSSVEERLLALEGDKDQLHLHVITVFICAFQRFMTGGRSFIFHSFKDFLHPQLQSGGRSIGSDRSPDGAGENSGQQERGPKENRKPLTNRDDESVIA